MTVFSTMIITYTIQVLMLNIVMNKMIGDLTSEIRSINGQFFTFLFVFAVRLIWALFMIEQTFIKDISNYAQNFIYFGGVVLTQLPIITIITLHHRAFKSRHLVSYSTQDRTTNPNNVTNAENLQFLSESDSVLRMTEDEQRPTYVNNITTESVQITEELDDADLRQTSRSANFDYLLQTTQGHQF